MYTIYICSMLYININHRKNRMWPTTDAMGSARVWRVCTSEYPAMPIVSIMSTIANSFSIRDCTYIVRIYVWGNLRYYLLSRKSVRSSVVYIIPMGEEKNQVDRTRRVPDILVYNWTPYWKWGNFSRVRRKLFSYLDMRHVCITSSHRRWLKHGPSVLKV
jgi:hypothetical protein